MSFITGQYRIRAEADWFSTMPQSIHPPRPARAFAAAATAASLGSPVGSPAGRPSKRMSRRRGSSASASACLSGLVGGTGLVLYLSSGGGPGPAAVAASESCRCPPSSQRRLSLGSGGPVATVLPGLYERDCRVACSSWQRYEQ